MNKRKYLILLIMLLPVKVNAIISLNCPQPILPNTNINCNITSSANITHFESQLLVREVKYTGAVAGANFSSGTSSTNLLFTSSSGGTNIGLVQLSVASNKKAGDIIYVNLTKIKYTQNNEVKLLNDISKEFKVGSNTTTTKVVTTPPSSSKTFTVTLDSNNGTNKLETLSCDTNGSNCNIDLTKAVKPVKTGADFAGWGNNQSCTLGNTTSYKAANNVTLYACWKVNQTETTPDNDLFLNKLDIEGQVLGFSKFKLEYDLIVLYEIESLNIDATASSDDINVEISETALEVGDNVITIKLTDKEAKTKEYTINVKRLKEGEIIKVLSTDATLKSVSFDIFSVKFSPTIVDYTLEIDSKTKSIPVTAITNDENATYDVSGNTDITDKSIIKITVTAEDGTINTYNFHISIKLTFFEQYKLYLAIGGVLLLLLIILISINKSKKRDKKSNKKTKVAPVKVPKKAPKSVPRTTSSMPSSSPSIPTPTAQPKSQVEVLDI